MKIGKNIKAIRISQKMEQMDAAKQRASDDISKIIG